MRKSVIEFAREVAGVRTPLSFVVILTMFSLALTDSGSLIVFPSHGGW
jgi:hypothetical protein